MSTRRSKFKGNSRNELRARILVKQAKRLWHFGPKRVDPENRIEPVELMVRRLRYG